jgi:hypothetical protein
MDEFVKYSIARESKENLGKTSINEIIFVRNGLESSP